MEWVGNFLTLSLFAAKISYHLCFKWSLHWCALFQFSVWANECLKWWRQAIYFDINKAKINNGIFPPTAHVYPMPSPNLLQILGGTTEQIKGRVCRGEMICHASDHHHSFQILKAHYCMSAIPCSIATSISRPVLQITKDSSSSHLIVLKQFQNLSWGLLKELLS